jgi:hypothetical protein
MKRSRRTKMLLSGKLEKLRYHKLQLPRSLAQVANFLGQGFCFRTPRVCLHISHSSHLISSAETLLRLAVTSI